MNSLFTESTANMDVVDDSESNPLMPNVRETGPCKPNNTWDDGSSPLVESTNKRLNSRQMAMEKDDNDILSFRILGKPEVTSGEC